MKKAITVPVGESMVTFSVFSELQVAMKPLPWWIKGHFLGIQRHPKVGLTYARTISC